jgi:hypothetical protein
MIVGPSEWSWPETTGLGPQRGLRVAQHHRSQPTSGSRSLNRPTRRTRGPTGEHRKGWVHHQQTRINALAHCTG